MAVKESDPKKVFRDTLVKISNVFKNDLYIVHNKYVIAGSKSSEDNIGYYLLDLKDEAMLIYKEFFHNNPILYIPEVKEAKDNKSAIKIITDSKHIEKIENTVDNELKQYDKLDLKWHPFNLSDEELDAMYDRAESITLFHGDKEKSEVIVSKTMFPLATKKNIRELMTYAYDYYEENDNLNQILFSYTHPYFNLKMRYLFLTL